MDRAHWEGAISQAGDPAVLRDVAERLSRIREPWARLLQIRALAKARTLQPSLETTREYSTVPSRKTAITPWWERMGLPKPDGRPFWKYRLSPDVIANIERELKGQSKLFARLNRASPDFAPLFVIWAADRFRQRWQGEFNRWEFISTPLGLPFETQKDQKWLRETVDAGLRAWQLEPYRTGLGRMRVDSLLRQAGFPIAAVAADSGAKVAKWLRSLVAHAAGQADVDEAALLQAARDSQGGLPTWWQTPVFAELGVELALAVLHLRREAEVQAPTGVPPSLWLDKVRPDWRDDLPLTVADDAGRRLLDGLMNVEARRIPRRVGARRGFLLTGGCWQPMVRLILDGIMSDEAGLIADGYRRLRLHAVGHAARWLPGDLAVAEAVEDGGQRQWDIRSLFGETAREFPLEERLVCRFVSGGEPLGKPIELLPPARANVLVCVAVGEEVLEDDARPEELVISGAGSGAYVAKELWLLVPEGWQCSSGTCLTDQTYDGRHWWRTREECRVQSPEGDVTLIRPCQTRDSRDRVLVDAETVLNLSSVEGLPVWKDPIHVLVSSDRNWRNPQHGQIWWRKPGTGWQRWTSSASLPAGFLELAWRDQGLLRAREVGILLPRGFAISHEGSTLRLLGADPGMKVKDAKPISETEWRLNPTTTSSGQAVINWDGATLLFRLKTRATIATWEGARISPDGQLFLAELDRYVARVGGQRDRARLFGRVEDRYGRALQGSEAMWAFAEDLPLAAIASDIRTLLRPEGLGCRLVLEFQNGGNERWYVHEYRSQLEKVGDKLVPSFGVVDEAVTLAGRPVHDPAREEDIASCSLIASLNHRPISLPRFKGDWIVYLKRGTEVLSQPQLVQGTLPLHEIRDPLAEAQSIADRAKRHRALKAYLEEAAREPEGQRIRKLIGLVRSLGGLAPATFDVLAVIGEQVRAGNGLVAARMAMMATESELSAVLAIADGLPFLWPMIGREVWKEAAEQLERGISNGLCNVMDAHEVPAVVMSALASAQRRILAAQPALAHALEPTAGGQSVDDAANSFITRANDRIGPQGSHFSARSQRLLPNWPFDSGFWQALDAPCAVALHAAGRHLLSDADLRVARQIAARHPRWFAEGLAAFARGLS